METWKITEIQEFENKLDAKLLPRRQYVNKNRAIGAAIRAIQKRINAPKFTEHLAELYGIIPARMSYKVRMFDESILLKTIIDLRADWRHSTQSYVVIGDKNNV